MIGWKRFMTRAKIEDTSLAARVAATTAEHFTTGKPANKHERLRLRNVEELTIHFFALNVDKLANALGDGVSWCCHPQMFTIIGFTPLETTGCTHETLENL